MQKPITVAREEFIICIKENINRSGLPAFLISDVLRDLAKQMDKLAESQYQYDLNEWNAHKAEGAKDGDTE